jgi:hypothetical protein
MAVVLSHLALGVAAALGVYAGLRGSPEPLPQLAIALAAGYAAGAVAFLLRWLERRLRQSWWTPEQMAR